MKINITYDSSVANAPTGFKAAVEAAVAFYERMFNTSITINITIAWGNIVGDAIPDGALGVSTAAGYYPLNYNEMRNALWQNAHTDDTLAAAKALANGDPTNGGTFYVSSAEAKALGLINPTDTATDGYIGIDSATQYTFDPNNRAVAGLVDAIGVIEHEIGHILGRLSFLGETQPDGEALFSPLDLFRYSSPGVLAPSSAATWFSLTGQSLLMPFDDPSNGGSNSDWNDTKLGDVFCAFGDDGMQDVFSSADYSLMDVLGYHVVPKATDFTAPNATPVSSISTNTSVSIADGTIVFFQNGGGYSLTDDGAAPSITNAGKIVSTGYSTRTISSPIYGYDFAGATITNLATGSIIARGDHDAMAYYSRGDSPDIYNAGYIEAVALNGFASGIDTYGYKIQFTNTATGTLRVWAFATAEGVTLENGGAFSNAGLIDVTGFSATAVSGATSFSNSGTIRAIASAIGRNYASDSFGIAVDITKLPSTASGLAYVNSGTIIASDYAFAMDANIDVRSAPTFVLTNTGTVVGAIYMGDAYGAIHNSGTIAGNVYFGSVHSVYDGAGGHLYGNIYLEYTTNTVTLGSDGGIVYGGSYADTITGGSGDDFFDITMGNNTLIGGGGTDTLSLLSAPIAYTVDLGAGTAVGVGTTHVTAVNRVFGSTYNDTMIAGATGAVLVAGGGHDTLRGGAGADRLIAAGGGGDTMTGNGGDDTFVYEDGNGQLIITDFGANGNHDTLRIYGYAAALSLVQQGADTLITLSASDSILIKNATAASIAAGAISYFESGDAVPVVPQSRAVYGTYLIDATHDVTFIAGEVINISYTDGSNSTFRGILDEWDGFLDLRSIDNSTAMVFEATSGFLQGICCADYSAQYATFNNRTGASMTVTNTNGRACGIYGYFGAPRLINDGIITVSGTEEARGVYTYQDHYQFTNSQSGVFSVICRDADATGLYLYNGGVFRNDGQFTVRGGRFETYGVYFHSFDTGNTGSVLSPVINNGSIIVSSTGGTSIGIGIAGTDGNSVPAITNTGLIQAQVAIKEINARYSPVQVPSISVINSGTIIGDIDLGGSHCSVANTGTITGNILIHDDCAFSWYETYGGGGHGDTIDLRGGTLTGNIAITPGLNANSHIVHDTIYTGSTPTTIVVAGSQSKLTVDVTGTAGADAITLDLSSETIAVTAGFVSGKYVVNDASGMALNLTTIERFSIISGSGNDRLNGGGEHDTLTGGGGNDTLDGGANIDTAVFAGNAAAYTITQGATGVFTISGTDGTDTLTNIEYAKFDDKTVRLLPGTGATVDWAADPATYMAGIRDFDGNDLGAASGWKLIGTADVNGDGTAEHILVNRQNGRWAEISTEADGKSYFANNGWAGDTRIVGTYIDPLVANGTVVQGSDFDSQRRFQNDLNIENIHGVLGQGDYNHDGLQEIYFSLADGTAYLHAYMHADGNIQYANYQNEQQVKDYLTSNGFTATVWAGWFPAAAASLAAMTG